MLHHYQDQLKYEKGIFAPQWNREYISECKHMQSNFIYSARSLSSPPYADYRILTWNLHLILNFLLITLETFVKSLFRFSKWADLHN